MMSNEEQTRFQQIEAIFTELCDLPINQALAKLDDLAKGDPVVIQGVRSMLDADQRSYPALDSGALFPESFEDASIPESIGDFTVVRVLGEGGMGLVYEATQQSPSRTIALKVIRERSMHTKIGKRFQSEADILAKLNHPGIATIYSSGIAESDQGPIPYVAMELVDGLSLTQYCDSNKLNTQGRLKLLRDVSRAVGHAHKIGIVHRDLKPTNIMVDREGQVKILDFGIAVDISVQDRTQMTQTGQLMGTLIYMAPEQVARQSGSGQPQTDVYAIGLISYELLAGHSPLQEYDDSVLGMVKAIGDKDHTRLGTIEKNYRGDIETIVGKCLSKDIDRRYETADELADDIDRYLNNLPISARNPGHWYQFKKFSKRNPFIVGSMSAALLVLTISLVIISAALSQAKLDRQRALDERNAQKLINQFLTEDLFAFANPLEDGDPSITLLDAMRKSSGQIPIRFNEAPEAQASISATIGEQFRVMNDYDEALSHLQRSVEISEELNLPINTRVYRRNSLSDIYMDIDDLESALEIVKETNAMAESNRDIAPEAYIETLIQHGSLLYHMRKGVEATPIFERAVAFGRENLPNHSITDDAISSLAVVYTNTNRWQEALELHEETVQRTTLELGAEHPSALLAKDNICILYYQLDRFEEGVQTGREVLEVRLRVFGEQHVKTFITKSIMSKHLAALGQFEEAEEVVLDAYSGAYDFLGPEHRYTKAIRGTAYEIYVMWGKPEIAQRYAPIEES